MNEISKIKRVKIVFLLCMALVVAISAVVFDSKTEAESKVAVGHQSKEAQDGQQTERKKNALSKQADRKGFKNSKSAGCVVCHVGVESRHYDDDEETESASSYCPGGD